MQPVSLRVPHDSHQTASGIPGAVQFLELFGECEIFRSDLSPIVNAKLVRLNWEILPKGKLPWARLQRHLRPIVERQPAGNRIVIVACPVIIAPESMLGISDPGHEERCIEEAIQ